MFKLVLALVVIPLLELAILIEIGGHVGVLTTLGIIVLTGFVGIFLTRRAGLGVLRRLRAELDQGRLPAETLVDGLLILLAGAVLMTPGILTDALGFLCLIPTTRRWIKRLLWRWLKSAVQKGSVNVTMHFEARPPPPDPDRKSIPE